jgi:hypothetical protein
MIAWLSSSLFFRLYTILQEDVIAPHYLIIHTILVVNIVANLPCLYNSVRVAVTVPFKDLHGMPQNTGSQARGLWLHLRVLLP